MMDVLRHPHTLAAAVTLAASLTPARSSSAGGGAAASGGASTPTALQEVLERVRHATGWPTSLTAHDLVVRGAMNGPMGASDFTWRFGDGDRFLRKTQGGLNRCIGGDRDSSWIEDLGFRARRLEFADDENARLLSRVLSGQWLAPGSDVEVSAAPDSGNDLTRLTLALGRRRATLTIDTNSGEPRTLALHSAYGGETWTFLDCRKDGGLIYPRRLDQKNSSGGTNTFMVASVSREETAAPTAFARPASNPRPRFDPRVPTELRVERSPNGFLLVHPVIDGHEVGAFIFDTGAGRNVITPKLADSLGLGRSGTSSLKLAAGTRQANIRKARTLSLGPLTIENPTLIEMDLGAGSAQLGVELNGIIGYDVLMRSRVEIEIGRSRLSVQDPETAPSDLPWEPIAIYGNHVYVQGEVEHHAGWFRLDTGAPQVPVILNGPMVTRFDLLNGRDVERATIAVPGGTMDVALGTVDQLRIGGHTFEKLRTLFSLGSGGAFDDEYTLGNLGPECLEPFRAVFDYANSRMALVGVTSPGQRDLPHH